MTTIKELKEHIARNYKDGDHVAYAIWSLDDVIERAKENEVKISKKQAEELLDTINDSQDCTQGITWNSIDNELDELEEKIEKEKVRRKRSR